MDPLRRARFRIAWGRTRTIFSAVSGGLFVGFFVSMVAPEIVGQIAAALVAFVLLIRAWGKGGRPEVAPEMPASGWRFPVLALAVLLMIAGMAGTMFLLPAWAYEWVAAEIVVVSLTFIVTANDALGPSTR